MDDMGASSLATQKVYVTRFGWSKRIRSIRQSEVADCGLACIAMISTFHGHEIDVHELRRRFNPSPNGTSLATLIRISDKLNLKGRPIRLDMDELPRLSLPCVLHVDMNHFVVLSKLRGNKAEIHDPRYGRQVVKLSDLSRRFTGAALELAPSKDFTAASAKPPKPAFWRIFFRVKGVRATLGNVFAMALLLEIAGLFGPLLVQGTIDQIIGNHNLDLLVIVAIAFAGLAATQSVISALRSWALTAMGLNLSVAWSSDIFSHLIKLPENFFMKRHLGDIVSRFSSLEQIHSILGSRSAEIVPDGIFAFVSGAVLFYYSSLLAIITLVSFAIFVVARLVTLSLLQQRSTNQITLAAQQQSTFLEAVRGATEIKLNNATHLFGARFQSKAVETTNAMAAVSSITIVFSAFTTAIFGFGRAAVICTGAVLAVHGRMSAGMLMAFMAYSDQFTGRVSSLIDFIVQLRMVSVHSDRLSDIVMATTEQGTEAQSPAPASGVLEFVNVSFRYSANDPWILENCSFRVESGATTAVTGPSGCGKSTLLKIACGLLEPNAGRVEIGGVDVRQIGKDRIRELTSTVMQDAILFEGTIRENISFFNPHVEEADIVRSATQACIHRDIEALPMKYRTRVGDMGSSLSGGQKQRICLARALCRQPEVLLLDEATSHLDDTNAAQITENLAGLGLTKLIISHRRETIEAAHHIYVMRGGRLWPATPHHGIPARGTEHHQEVIS